MFDGIEAWVLDASGSLWVLPVLLGLVILDGFFPPVPSETAVITLAVAAVAPGGPNIVAVIVIAALGAWIGDQIAYLIGRLIGTERVPFLRRSRGKRMVEWAHSALGTRGASFILAARFIPIGRVAVNMAAGALRFEHRRFLWITAIASSVWALFQSLIGIAAASWLKSSSLLAMAAGIVIGLGLGFALDKVLSRFAARKAAAADGSQLTEPDPFD